MSTQARTKPAAAPEEARSRGDVAVINPPRLPYPAAAEERFGVDRSSWKALVEAVWPLAKTADAVVLALSYCKARRLDPFKRPVHIVPMWNGALKREIETVWPGVAELRTTAFRTGLYAGADETSFGPTVESSFAGEKRGRDGEPPKRMNVTLKHPEWAQVTVYRMVGGQRVAFPGPRCLFTEWFGYRQGVPVPNDRWARAPLQMLEKCAEAAALRKAFPEEIGDEPTAEEQEGRVIDPDGTIVNEGPTPQRPTRADFTEAKTTDVEDEEAAGFTGDVSLDVMNETATHDPETGEVAQPAATASPQAERAAPAADTKPGSAQPAGTEEALPLLVEPAMRAGKPMWADFEKLMRERAGKVKTSTEFAEFMQANKPLMDRSAINNPDHKLLAEDLRRVGERLWSAENDERSEG